MAESNHAVSEPESDKSPEIPYGPLQKPWRDTVSHYAVSTDGKLLISAPDKADDYTSRYPHVFDPAYTKSLYQIPSTGLSEQQQSLAYEEIMATVKRASQNFLGFQGNFNHKDCAAVKPFVDSDIMAVNQSNPFTGVTYEVCLMMERSVLDYFACLWNAKWPHDPDDPGTYWGYVLAMGATEGNIQAMWNARDYLCGCVTKGDDLQTKGSSFATAADIVPICPQDNPNIFSPVAFYSTSTHPGIKNALHLVQVPTFYEVGRRKYPNDNPLSPGKPWPCSVPTNTDGDRLLGTVNIDVLTALVDFFSAKGHPIIVILNYGTAFEGAFDDVKGVGEAIIPILKKNNMYSYKICYEPECSNLSTTRHGFWFHVDGALGASYMPFVEMAHKKGLLQNEASGPVFDFRLDFVSSITFSGYKWLGTTWPCGVYMTKTGLMLGVADKGNLLQRPLTATVCGTKNALSSMLLWTRCCKSYDKQVETVVSCLELAQYAEKKFKEVEKEVKMELWISRADTSLAILFKAPNKAICKKFYLLCHNIMVNGEERCYAHIYIMPSVPRDRIDTLIQDLRSSNAFKN